MVTLAGESGDGTAQVTDSESGPARNRTANPLTKSSLADDATTDHDLLPPEFPDEYEP